MRLFRIRKRRIGRSEFGPVATGGKQWEGPLPKAPRDHSGISPRRPPLPRPLRDGDQRVTARELRHILFEADQPGLTVLALRQALTGVEEQDQYLTFNQISAIGILAKAKFTATTAGKE